MYEILVRCTPAMNFAYEVEIVVIDADGTVLSKPMWSKFSWLGYDLTGEPKPWQRVLREVAGLAD